MTKKFIKGIVPYSILLKINKLKDFLYIFIISNNLNKLGQFYGTDKTGYHFYTPHYMTHLRKFRLKRINLLEIGIGGYDNSLDGGRSLRMWKQYFPFGRIFGLDLYDKSSIQEKRIKTFIGNQSEKNIIDKIVEEIGTLDIVIDDGSHINEDVINTFKLLFPKLKEGGIYIIEDTQTSYWEEYGGDNKDLNNPNTTLNYFKYLTDSLNNSEFRNSKLQIDDYNNKIVSIHFYHNLIFIYKGNNNVISNVS